MAMASAKEGLVCHTTPWCAAPWRHAVDQDIRCQRHHAEPAKERGGGSGDGSFRPLALGFHAQVSPQLLKGHLDLPPQQIPLQYPQGFRLGVGA